MCWEGLEGGVCMEGGRRGRTEGGERCGPGLIGRRTDVIVCL